MVSARRMHRWRPLSGSKLGRSSPVMPTWVKRMLAMLLVAFTFLGILLPYLWIQAEINEASAERRTWSRILNETIEEHQALQFRLSELQSARRIEQVAIERLGMEKPTQVIHVEPTLH